MQILLVGDPLQLPPTVLSRLAETAKLSQSMFERLQRAGCPATLLSQQYRMHPDISRLVHRAVVGWTLSSTQAEV